MSQPNHHLTRQKWVGENIHKHHFGITTQFAGIIRTGTLVPYHGPLVNCHGHPRSCPDFYKTSVAMAKAGKVAMFSFGQESTHHYLPVRKDHVSLSPNCRSIYGNCLIGTEIGFTAWDESIGQETLRTNKGEIVSGAGLLSNWEGALMQMAPCRYSGHL